MPEQRTISAGLRVWHWLDGITVVCLISTFFLRKSLTSHSRYLISELNKSGLNISDATAKPIIRDMVNQLWNWHIYFGYVLTALFVWRVIVFFKDETSPLKECWAHICRAKENFDFRNVHSAFVKSGYIVFYVLQIFMILSGLTLVFAGNTVSKSSMHSLHEVHEAVMWFFLVFVIAHVAGVFFAENTNDPGIASGMINGHRSSNN